MKKSSYFYTSLFVGLFLVTLVLFYWFIKSPQFIVVDNWVKQNTLIYVVLLVFIKTIGLIWPPIPAGLFTMLSIPFLGWFGAYIVDLMGSIIGGSIAYFLGKKYGLTLLRKIFDEKMIERIKKTKIKKGREIEAIFMYRIFLGTTIIEAINYGAGLLKVGFSKFLVGAILSHIVVGIPMFILAQNIFGGKNIVMTVALVILGGLFVYKTKGRYFE